MYYFYHHGRIAYIIVNSVLSHEIRLVPVNLVIICFAQNFPFVVFISGTTKPVKTLFYHLKATLPHRSIKNVLSQKMDLNFLLQIWGLFNEIKHVIIIIINIKIKILYFIIGLLLVIQIITDE